MVSDVENGEFTVYLDGHEGHRGNVLAHSFLAKIQRLIIVLNKLERAFADVSVRQTDFEIVDADKYNPTTLSLKPVPRNKGYDPIPAIEWGLAQIETVSNGSSPDKKVSSDIAFDLVKLATKDSEFSYRSFWINGRAAPIRFDEEFLRNAERIARDRQKLESPLRWRAGSARGSVVGELKKVDDLEGDNEFVIVPPVGAKRIVCTFSSDLREVMGSYLFKVVKVSGSLHYGEASPFPFRVDATDITEMPRRRKSIRELRGVFSGRDRTNVDWGVLLDGA